VKKAGGNPPDLFHGPFFAFTSRLCAHAFIPTAFNMAATSSTLDLLGGLILTHSRPPLSPYNLGHLSYLL